MGKYITGKQHLTLHQLIREQAKKHPDKIAIRHNGNTITYNELHISSNQVAAYLIANKITNNDIVAVAMDRSIKLMVCLLGIIKAGAAYLPIDPNLPADRVNFILNDCSSKTLCTSREYAGLYKSNNKIIFDDVWIKRHNYPADELTIEHNGTGLAYILYTSGSTGQPKGVAIEQHSLLNLLLSIQKEPGMGSNDIMLGITTISFDIAELELFLPLISGAQLIIVDADVAKDGRALLEIIKTERISIVQATPFTWRMLLQSGWDKRLPIKAFCGGEAMPKELAQKLLDRCDELWNMYGPTETTIYSTIKKIAPDDELITIGKPIANTQVYILDKDRKKVADGEEGEIYIGGEGVAREYVCRPELNAERFIEDDFSGNPGNIYKTGDWGKLLDNGEIQYLGRIDHQIKIRGYRIETEEIEQQLKLLRGIKQALIVLHEDKLGNKQLVAYIVGNRFATIYHRNKKIRQWKNSLKTKLPTYMVPAAFIILSRIPLMPNGKVDRKMLPPPAPKRLSRNNKKPRTKTELAITRIILKNTGFETVGIDDNFIDLGIDSLVALMIIVDIEEEFDKRLPLTVLVHHPTIKLLARFINSVSASPYNSLIPMKKDGAKVPLYLIHGIGLNLFNFNGLITHLDAEQPVYGLRAAGLDGNIEPLESIETIAAYYNQEIFNHDPIGPYAIAGYSFGGIVAYEMVKQMTEAGKTVEMLAMFDTNLQGHAPNASLVNRLVKKVLRQVGKLIFRTGSFIKDPAANIAYLKQLYQQKAKKSLTNMSVLNKYQTAELPEYMQKVVDKLEAAWAKYLITPYEVNIDLFKAKKRLFYVDDPAFLGWAAYAQDGVTTYSVPGDHKEMFYPPNDKILAEALQKRLNNIPANTARILINDTGQITRVAS